MATLLQQLERAKKLSPEKIEQEIFNYIKKIENVFFDLNIRRLEDSEDSKGGLLTNKNSKYSGVYTKQTEEIARTENPLAPKIEGEPYNFLYGGDFLKGFEMFVKTGSVEIFSTGTGSGDKKDFFDGYTDLFNQKDEDLKMVIQERILPFLQNNIIRKGLGI